MNWSEFFSMGGYAVYVWGSYAVATVVLLLNLIIPLRRRSALRRQLHDAEPMAPQTDQTGMNR